ncbi:MAG: ROK family protein [Chloroherpetonaceae bacterium]|nr:ROK family protein [Chloroherpetonaceae bacterium]MDW8437348.1 ROK family protein [Chloroherpetonaceae bacterium]
MLWGIDLGGTKIECAVLESPTSSRALTRQRIETQAEKGYAHILAQIKRLVDDVADTLGKRPTKIGVGTPGALEPSTQTLKNSNTVCLNGKPFKRDLEQVLGVPIKIANDANCFALAEARLGAAKGASVVFGVIMGTGVGGGIVVDGKVIGGRQGIAGEWGHNVLEENGELCYCGKRGCVETVLSGVWLEKFYQARSGESRKLKDIVERHRLGTDENATLTIKRLTENFGKAIAVVINILDPDVIVLGGGVGNIDLLYGEGVEEAKKHVFNHKLETAIVKPILGDSAGVFGAAMLVAE